MFGAVWAQAEVRKVLGAIGARVLDEELPVPTAHERLEDGRLTDAEIERRLAGLLGRLVDAVRERDEERAAA